eukprot:TRINITY_DN4880_c0_g1_i1.p1 TRINITY_DN4880_c0_g1~~TRINITY_DN4880_c0_g1_i1.p1  ORF type:complete len:214 (-),score=76.47 TRINITY_DN4880_c0_g1_i1:121-762(-)
MSQTGTCKSFSARTGFGFIIGPDGKDIYVHARDCVNSMIPQQGDIVSYDMAPSKQNPGTMIATNVTGGTAKQTPEGAAIIMNGTGAFEGEVKSFNPNKAFGFIKHEGEDLFFHGKSCKGSYPTAGDVVKYDIEDSPVKAGEKHAVNITGGSVSLFAHRDKGKGKGKGKMGPYGMESMDNMMSMMMMSQMMKGMLGGMFGGKGKGFGKGKGDGW